MDLIECKLMIHLNFVFLKGVWTYEKGKECGIAKCQIVLGSFLVKCSLFYFFETGLDILSQNNFLQFFHKVLFDTLQSQIHFKTSCGHWIVVSHLKHAYTHKICITFHSFRSMWWYWIFRKTKDFKRKDFFF